MNRLNFLSICQQSVLVSRTWHLLHELSLEEARWLFVEIWQRVISPWNLVLLVLVESLLLSRLQIVLLLGLLIFHILNGECIVLVLVLINVHFAFLILQTALCIIRHHCELILVSVCSHTATILPFTQTLGALDFVALDYRRKLSTLVWSRCIELIVVNAIHHCTIKNRGCVARHFILTVTVMYHGHRLILNSCELLHTRIPCTKTEHSFQWACLLDAEPTVCRLLKLYSPSRRLFEQLAHLLGSFTWNVTNDRWARLFVMLVERLPWVDHWVE